jgi:hypothetical protein
MGSKDLPSTEINISDFNFVQEHPQPAQLPKPIQQNIGDTSAKSFAD